MEECVGLDFVKGISSDLQSIGIPSKVCVDFDRDSGTHHIELRMISYTLLFTTGYQEYEICNPESGDTLGFSKVSLEEAWEGLRAFNN